jgi:thiamine biosynthesis protein ThiI
MNVMPVLVLHYHEMWLKGRNRNFFLRKFTESVRRQLGGLGPLKIEQEDGRVLVSLGSGEALGEAAERMKKIFGLAHYSIAQEVDRDLAAVEQAAWGQLAAQPFRTFAIRARRADKTLPFRSQDAERRIGRFVLESARAAGREIAVDLDHPQTTCFIEFTRNRALVFSQKLPGPGGMAANTAGKLTCLLSGGYDSAVAAYLMMKRGARLIFVHFYGIAARPGEASEPVAREIVRTLAAYQGGAKLYLVPFYDLQREVVLGAPEPYRILIYRRLMLRIAECLARRHHALGLITGDSLAQVASQTLQNMAAVGAAARLPLYRPLVGADKQEILDLARRIGTYEISSERFTDCCPIFLPRHPRIYASVEELNEAEARLDVPAMVRRGVAAAHKEIYTFADGRVIEERNAPSGATIAV